MSIRTCVEGLENLQGLENAEPIQMTDWLVGHDMAVQEWLRFARQ